MSLTTPTTREINENIIAQLQAALNQTIPLLPRSFLRVLAKVLSGVFILLYKYAGFMFLQQFVARASYNETEINGVVVRPLLEWGRLIGVGDPRAATNAELLIDITVEVQAGTLPSGSQLVNSSNGVTYITIGSVLLDAATVQATIRAVADQSGGGGVGAIGNLDPGDIVSFANPLANVARDAVVNSQVITGANAEDIEVYRQRVIDRFQQPPQGGAYSDYKIWGEEVEGIINVYPYTGDNPGEATVYAEATVESSGDPDGKPTPAQLQQVLDSINFDENGLASRRPANALVNAFQIQIEDFDVTVTGLAVDNLADVQAQIQEAVEEYFEGRRSFIDGLTIPPRTDIITRSALIGLVEDIVTANNGIFTTVTFNQTGVPVGIELFYLGEGFKSGLGAPVVFN